MWERDRERWGTGGGKLSKLAAVGARVEAIRNKDAEIVRLRWRMAWVPDVDAGVTRVVEEAGAGAEPPLKRMRLEQAASARVVGVLQERLVEVKKEQLEKRATRHLELRASADAKVKAAGGLGAGGQRPGVRLLL